MDVRIDTIRQGRNAARMLRQRAREGGLSTEELELLLGKIDDGFETALDVEQLRGGDFPETTARMAAAGLKATDAPLLRGPAPRRSLLDWSREAVRPVTRLVHPEPGPTRIRTVGHLGIIDGDRP